MLQSMNPTQGGHLIARSFVFIVSNFAIRYNDLKSRKLAAIFWILIFGLLLRH